FQHSEIDTRGIGKALMSNSSLKMKKNSPQRFQLREKAVAGGIQRVLMRRLPNASLDKIGKERTPDGQNLLVAEIYIHQ
ncbi:MAG: hypothetical protein K2P84_08060, partial [Undibacterium sp.]|nr:hypothetical protein [Undibacterium sp.]